MGIDIYARWRGQTEVEKGEQYRSLWTTSGRIGYLREAYHGEPYATMFLCQEAFDSETASAQIPASVLRERLPETLRLAEKRERDVYDALTQDEIEHVLESFRAFVSLCEAKEKETGEPVTIIASY